MLIITGKSCSGKDTICKELVTNQGFKKLITYTNRPIRPNEKFDVDYHFITTEEFLRKYMDGFFLEARYYETEFGLWFYGSSVESYQQADDDTVAILTPSGINRLFENNIKHTSVYIDVSDETIKQRQIERKDKIIEAKRRFESDIKDFIGIYDMVDFIVDNDNRDIKEVAEEVVEMYEIYGGK